MNNENKQNWFKLDDVKVDFDKYNNFENLKEKLEKADLVKGERSWNYDYIKIEAKLTFIGTLQTPNGSIDTEFPYFIKTSYRDMLNEAKITIYEQTFTGLDEAVTIRFSSGSIISKIVFGDIEKCYSLLKQEVKNQIAEYDEKVKEFNKEIDKLREQKNKESEK